MNTTFGCGHVRSEANSQRTYGRTRCRECQRGYNRRYAQRKRAEFIAQYGRYDACTNP